MNNRRIGTLTLAFILIAVGLLMLAASFTNIDVYKVIYYVWPAALILLGVEILIKNYSSKEVIKLDFGAFVLIFLVLFGSAAFFVANDIGLVNELKYRVNTVYEYRSVDINPIVIGADIEKVVIDTEGHRTTVESSDNSKISGHVGVGVEYIRGEDVQLSDYSFDVITDDKVMYITVKSESSSNYNDINLQIPSKLAVEINGSDSFKGFLSKFEKRVEIVGFTIVELYGTEGKRVGYSDYMSDVVLEKRENLSNRIDDYTDVVVREFYELMIKN